MDTEAPGGATRVLTVPNGLSVIRLLGVPLFLWLVLVPRADAWALVVLALSGFTDWLDGKLARAWNQTSRFGAMLDPAADRLYILATVVGLTVRGVIPLWFAVALLARDAFITMLLPPLRRQGYGPLPVHFLGKAATLCLLYAFPFLFFGERPGQIATLAQVAGWAFAIWGTALYWWAAVLYAVQVRQLARTGDGGPGGPDDGSGRNQRRRSASKDGTKGAMA